MKSLFFSLIIVAFVATSCSRQLDKDPFTVVGVTDGNTLLLDNGYKVVLLGIAPTEQCQKEIFKICNEKDVWFIFDKKTDPLDYDGANLKFYAYVITDNPIDGPCVNSILLEDGISKLNITPLLNDSLASYKMKAKGVYGEDQNIEPVPVSPNPDPEDEGAIIPSNYQNSSYDGDWSDTPSVFNYACDYRNDCTRNFATSIAGKAEGPFSEKGINQVCEIFKYLYNKWKYVNDPKGADYYAKASESIAVSHFTGDCDDFAILMASCVMAIGGEARITFSFKPDGGHAFTEVDISQFDFDEVLSTVADYFPNVTSLNTRDSRKWLNLDWSASHPGGNYYDGSRNEFYEYDFSRNRWERH